MLAQQRILMKTLILMLLSTISTYAQSTRCSYVNNTIGYSYEATTGEYRQSVRSIDRVQLCQGPETIAIGEKTTFFMGEAIEEVRDKKGKTYRMHATNEKRKPLILEEWFSNEVEPKMVITAIYPKLNYVEYHVE